MGALSDLLNPDRVAVVGATDADGSVGRTLMDNLSTFDGAVIPVNPNRDSVFGMPCYPTVEAIPEVSTIDLAIVVVPAPQVVDALRQIGAAGITNVVVISAGFSERGEAGEQRERELVAVADEYDLTLVGPNSVGVMNTARGLNATFLGTTPTAGSLSLMSQSGAIVSAVLDWASDHGIGFKNVISLGNEAVTDEVDAIEAWGEDPDTDVILAYLEDVDDGRLFVESTRRVTRHTPVVVLKSGRTEAGAKAAASHTGSIAGSDQAYEAGFRQGGALRVETIQEFFDVGRLLVGQPLLETADVAVVTNAGGPGVMTADALDNSRLSLADFGDRVRSNLADCLPDEADVRNPLDIIGDADLDRFRKSLDIVLADEGVGGVIVISVPTALFEFEALATVVGDLQSSSGKPVVASFMGGESIGNSVDVLNEYGIPNYFDPARAVASLAALDRYGAERDRVEASPTTFDVDRERAREILSLAEEHDVDYLSVEAMDLLDAYGIPVASGDLATSAEEAVAVAETVGEPVVMKVASPDVLHKTDFGGVEIGVSVADVPETFETLVNRAKEHDPDATILGIRVEAFVDMADGTETIVGATRDQQFGHLVLFGLGGIFVQVFEDTAFRIAPVSADAAREMTAEIESAPILRGVRGRTPADVDGIVEVIQRISQLVTDFPAIEELDVNPLLVGSEEVRAVDFRLTLDRDAFADE